MRTVTCLCLFLISITASALAEEKVTPYNALAGKQHDYYLRVFDYTMENTKAGTSFHWDTGTANGNIRVSEEYISKSKSRCRNFTETFIINNINGTDEGVACKRDGNGWCRLKLNYAHTCALENPQDMSDKIIGGVDKVIGNSKEMIRNTKDWWGR